MGHVLRIETMASDPPPLSLEIDPATTFDEWVGIGRRLCFGQQAVNWQIGDWWRHGVEHYGEESTRRAATEIWGVECETARNYGWVAGKFSPVERSTNLPFSHYLKVAALPTEQALGLIHRAENEGLSVRDISREAQVIKVANDAGDDDGAGRQRIEEPLQKAQPKPLGQRELVAAYEVVVEFAEAIQEYRALSRREQDHLTVALTYLDEAHADSRPVPDDFEIIFVEQGRLACEDWYRASRITVNRWLITVGKRRLLERRADFVKFERRGAHPDKPEPIGPAPDDPMFAIAQKAAEFLRVNRYGGWVISSAISGGWLVGTVRKTSDELIAMAERQGFEAQSLSVEMARG